MNPFRYCSKIRPAEARKAWVEKLTAYHSAQYTGARRTGSFPRRANNVSKGYGQGGDAYLRPLVKTHPETGRKNLFVASHAFAIPGMEPEASTKLLDELAQPREDEDSPVLKIEYFVEDELLINITKHELVPKH